MSDDTTIRPDMPALNPVRLSIYRHPDVPGELVCSGCGYTMHWHYWIDGLPGAEVVCPMTTGDFPVMTLRPSE